MAQRPAGRRLLRTRGPAGRLDPAGNGIISSSYSTNFYQASFMPTYEYQCESCGKRFARIESIAKHARLRPVCPACKSKKVARLFTPFYAKTVRKS